jgi:hypothetical protein
LYSTSIRRTPSRWLHKLGLSVRKVATIICHQGSYIRQEYQLTYDRTEYALPTPPEFEMELDNEIDDSQRTINMMDASSWSFNMSDDAAASAEADDLPI